MIHVFEKNYLPKFHIVTKPASYRQHFELITALLRTFKNIVIKFNIGFRDYPIEFMIFIEKSIVKNCEQNNRIFYKN